MDESAEVKGVSDTPEVASSAGNQELDNAASTATGAQQDQTVSYATHRRLLKEKKKQDELLEALKGRVEGLEFEKMEKEGEYKSAWLKTKEELDRARSEIDQQQKAFAWNSLNNNIKSVAVRMGMKPKAVDMFVKSLESDDLEAIEMEGLNPNADDIKKLVEARRQSHSFMFKDSSRAIDDLPPTSKVEKPTPKKATLDELMNELRARNKQQQN